MNKSELRKFATEVRIELLEKVELQARKIGITAESIQEANVESSDAVFIDGKQLSDIERRQRNKLISRINEIGFERVMEETAYTWFNRFIALRYMEVNDYLPTKVRVFSSDSGSAEPDMMKEALSLNLDLDKEKVYEMKMNNETDELFKYLIKMHCNDLNRYMPFMFETIEDYTEILFPEGLLGTDSFVRKMTDTEVIPEDNWEKVEIIGWLYQYYISDEKDQVFADLKKNIKITKDTIPAATQLFTPSWIVRYMVENSLGRIWLQSYPKSSLKDEWKYYIDDAEQEEEVIKRLEEFRDKNINPEEITFLDPCCGSGHILVYAFDVFYDMYLEKGYIESDIPQLILEKNIFGLDIDDRAVQLASFAVMMKAREKSRRIFRQETQLNICAIQESNWLTDDMIELFADENNQIKDVLYSIRNSFLDVKEYGSVLQVEEKNSYKQLEKFLQELKEQDANLIELIDKQILEEKLPALIMQSKIMTGQFDVVCTNPPYMGGRGMNIKLTKYLKENYPNTKSDLSTVMMEKSISLCKKTGVISMINIPVWMFIKSYAKLRENIITQNTILNMIHFGRGVFGSDFGTTAFVISKSRISQYEGVYRRLFKKQGAVDSLEQKEKWFFDKIGYFTNKQENFSKVPGSPIAYWTNEKISESFSKYNAISESFIPKFGMSVGDSEQYIRNWYEVNIEKIKFDASNAEEFNDSKKKWVVLDKGGPFRRWYGNKNQIVLWEEDGKEIKGNPKSAVRSPQYFFQPHISWTLVTSYKFSVRYFEQGFILDTASNCLYFKNEVNSELYALGFLNTKVAQEILNVINPTINYSCGVIGLLPYKVDNAQKKTVETLVLENIDLAKKDWNAYEESWDFEKHPLLMYKRDSNSIEYSFEYWENESSNTYNKLKENEEKLNQIFIELYGLQDEFTPEVEEKDVTIRKADLERDIKSLISYAIGCSFGRYSLNEEGLVYAGGEFDSSRYQSYTVDEDNVIPILPDPYFEDDIVTRIVDFLRVTFSEETLEENLEFIADAIGRRKNETARETLRRYFLNDFYKDHLKVYNKSPIYWMFTSGKEKAFNCLIYMHRYDKSTLSRIRTDYLHEIQTRMDAEKNDLLEVINGDSTTREINSAKRELKALDRKIDELKKYDELLHHMADMQIEIDLDDGVKVNYEKFKGLVAKI